jgi:microcystin-dependent protein
MFGFKLVNKFKNIFFEFNNKIMFSNNTSSNLFIQEYFKKIIPAGSILTYAGTEVPRGWKNCNGTELERKFYPELFKAIGTKYGTGNGSTTFNLPNFKGRVPVCTDLSQSEFDEIGKIGGAKTHTLSINEMPSHNHGGTTSINGLHLHSYTDTYRTGTQDIFAASGSGITAADETSTTETKNTSLNGNHDHIIGSQGNNQSHNILQPYIVINYIIKCH